VHANNWHGAKLCCPANRKWAKHESSINKKADLIYGDGVLQTTNVADAAAAKDSLPPCTSKSNMWSQCAISSIVA
jgi:hypothetical protein